MFVRIIVIAAKTKVTAIFPVKFAPPGNNPNKLLIHIKKKTVKRYGINLRECFLPIFGMAISSLTNMIIGSRKD